MSEELENKKPDEAPENSDVPATTVPVPPKIEEALKAARQNKLSIYTLGRRV